MNCPICDGPLEKRRVAPCYDCGHEAEELIEFERGEHEYHLFTIWGQTLVLCDFCDVDFGSYSPGFLGLPPGSPMDYPLEMLDLVESPELSDDLVCTACAYRLAFLNFLAAARKQNAALS